MDVSRRDFLRASAAAGGAAALGGLAGLGADLAPTLAAAAELRIKDAKTYPSICPYCSVGCATLVHTVDGKIATAYPWLEHCGVRLGGHTAHEHPHAWCPICGSWATLAEARGLEGARTLRCGRCGGDWRAQWLRCPFCGTDEHARLRGLVGADTGESRRADGCAACSAWVKTIATLGASTTGELRLLDLATVELDVAALERG